MLDKMQYESKPKMHEGIITNRLMNSSPTSVSVKELSEALSKGQTFTPATFKRIDGVIKRRPEYWDSQQVICIDYDNEIMVDGKKVKDVRTTVDDAIRIHGKTTAFIYKTFSYADDHPKFRVIEVLDRPIVDKNEMKSIMDYYSNKYPNADPSSFQLNRMFYGGTGLLWSKFENVISVDRILKDTLKTPINMKNKDDGLRWNNNKSNILIVPPTNSNQSFILDEDIDILRERLDRLPLVFNSRNEMLDHFKQQSLIELLDIDEVRGNFSCIFHEDNNPSANIIVNENGHQVYHCFSSNCPFRSGTIIQVIEYITGKNRVETLNFLKDIYNVQYEELGWVKTQREYVEENIRFLQSDEFEKYYPEVYEIIRPYIGLLLQIHRKAIENIITENYSDENNNLLFFSSARYLSQESGVKLANTSREIGIYSFLGLLRKLPSTSIPSELLERAIALAKQKEQRRMVNYYGVVPYSRKSLDYSTKKAKEFKDNGFTRKGWSREMILRTYGDEETNRVFPQLEGEKIPEKNNHVANDLEILALELIEQNGGYVLESKITENLVLTFKGQQEFKRTQLKRIMASLLDGYGLKRSRLTKELRNKFHLEGIRGNPYIIVKEESESKGECFDE